MSSREASAEQFRVGPILIFSAVLFCNVLSRTIFSPLLLSIERDLGVSHAAGGRLFLFLAIGYSTSMLLSGFVSRALRHRWTILVAIVGSGLSLFLIASGREYATVAAGLVALGAANGLYIPSGIASVYAVSHRSHWGKAISVHEVGPSIGLVIGPLLAEVAVRSASWRVVVAAIGAAYLAVGAVYLVLRIGAEHRGAPPVFTNVSALIAMPKFWISVIFFWLAATVAIGGYSVLPAFLVAERGISQTVVNTAISASRVLGVLMTVATGFVVDRFDTTKALTRFWLVTVGLTIALALVSGVASVVATVLLIAAMGAAFPGAFAAAARIEDRELHNVAVSITIPAGYLIGGGLLPAGLGALGERGMFWLGYLILGLIAAAAIGVSRMLQHRAATSKTG